MKLLYILMIVLLSACQDSNKKRVYYEDVIEISKKCDNNAGLMKLYIDTALDSACVVVKIECYNGAQFDVCTSNLNTIHEYKHS